MTSIQGQVAVRMGPVRLNFGGTAQVIERDEAAKRLVLHATGAEAKGRGQASMDITATLSRTGQGTKVAVAQDLQLSGAAAQYGRGMISDVTSVLTRDFSARMQDPGSSGRSGVSRPSRSPRPRPPRRMVSPRPAGPLSWR